MKLSDITLFAGIAEENLSSVLNCLGAAEKQYTKGEVIFAEGDVTEQLGIVLHGQVLIQYSDISGNTSILGSAKTGDTFGEAYACSDGEPMQISAVAAEKSEVLFLNVNRVLTTCPNSCHFHSMLIRNLLTVCSKKNLALSRRMLHTTPKTIRGRLISYFSQCVKEAKSSSFLLPYNRQQLADYLGVDRSAMCAELSKMQRDGIIRYDRNMVKICRTDDISFV